MNKESVLKEKQKKLGTRWIYYSKTHKCWASKPKIEKEWVYNASPEKISKLSSVEFGQYCHTISDIAANTGTKQSKKIIAKYGIANILNGNKRFNGLIRYLGIDSAKVIHTGMAARWFNAVQYLAPADMAMVSFIKEFGIATTRKLIHEVQKAANEKKEWKSFSSFNQYSMASVLKAIENIQKSSLIKPDLSVQLPNSKNSVRPMSLCPFASPVCRAVCLNTAGRAGIVSTKKDSHLYKEVISVMEKDGILEGETKNDLLLYYYLRGKQAYYGGANNEPIASRIKRTHLMWYIWAQEGVLKNSYNDMLYLHALELKKLADFSQVPLAVRLNGTSDIPYHTLSTTDGKNLIEKMGNKGIVCYDYTKDFTKMLNWLSVKPFAGEKIVRSGVRGFKKEWPKNYYLCFSWNEINYLKSLKVLQKGGNVVMVFRRSKELDKKDPRQLPKKASGIGNLPTLLPKGELTGKTEDNKKSYAIINGDVTDLRFSDKPEPGIKNIGLPGEGHIIGLIAKGKAAKPFTKDMVKKLNRRFTLTGTTEKGGKFKIRENPVQNEEKRGIVEVDADLLRLTTMKAGNGWGITSTAMGT